MKRMIATAVLAIATTAGAAQAMTVNQADLNSIRNFAPQADLSNLTAQDVDVILSIIHSGDSEGDKSSRVKAWIRG
ncbi:hypothetical protein [Primorskyibacter sp. 2E233]|uniref:hypothetical protein n=1 Tax=Primorskyibacter sp. 2E233 TaxID=3413431 RepID=UPI003BF19054